LYYLRDSESYGALKLALGLITIGRQTLLDTSLDKFALYDSMSDILVWTEV